MTAASLPTGGVPFLPHSSTSRNFDPHRSPAGSGLRHGAMPEKKAVAARQFWRHKIEAGNTAATFKIARMGTISAIERTVLDARGPFGVTSPANFFD